MSRFKHIILLIFVIPLAIQTFAGGAAGGGGGTGSCTQLNTVATIVNCTNCTVVDGTASGTLGSDAGLSVTANGCGPVTIRVRYQFDWNQGVNVNWLHGISFNAGALWSSTSFTPPAGWVYMPNGVEGACSGQSYGPGYYFDGTAATSAPQQVTLQFIGPGGCTSTYQNTAYATNPCSAICGSNENQLVEISGNCAGTTPADMGLNINPGSSYNCPTCVSNDGNPGNNWGTDCTTNCPDFFFELTFCPNTSSPSNYAQTVSLQTSADGESGAWCLDGNCDIANSFNIAIANACGPPQPLNGAVTLCSTSTTTTNLYNSIGWSAGDTPVTTGTWTGPSTLSGGSVGGYTPSTMTPGVYTYTIGTAGCTRTATVTVTETTPPVITPEPDLPFCAGAAVPLNSFTSTPSSGVTYSWTNSNTAIGLASASGTGSVPAFTATNAGTTAITSNITVTPAIGTCAGTPDVYTITVNPVPVMTSANATTICSGQTLNFPLTANIPGTTFAWTVANNTQVTGETSGSGTALNNTLTATTTQNVVYTVTPTFNGCAGTPQTVTVTVNPVPVMTSANTATICSGQTVSIPLTATPTGATFTWIATPNANVTGESTTSQTTSTLSNNLVNTSTSVQNVIYSVTPTLAGCPGTAQTVTVTVNPAPVMTSAATASICSGQTVSIPLTSSPAGATFTWVATDNTNVTGESLTNQSSSTLSNTLTNNSTTSQNVTYTVTPTLAGCIGTPQTVTVTVTPGPVMTSANTATICSGQAVSIPLTSSPAGATFTWIATDNTNVTGESLTNQTTSTLNNTLTNTTATAQNVTYTVTPTLAGCIGTPQTVTVTVNPSPVVTSANTATICSGQAVNIPLTSNPAGATFTWIATDNTNVTGESLTNQTTSTLNNTLTNASTSVQNVTYTVTPTLAGCIGTPQTVTVTVNPLPIVTSANTATICSGQAVNIPLTSNPAGATFTWIATDNTNVTGESLTNQTTSTLNNTLTNTTATAQNVTYTVTPTLAGCIGTPQTVTVTVNPLPIVTSANTATICSGQAVNIPLTSNPAGATFTWIATDNTSVTGESLTNQTTSTLNNTLTNTTATAQNVTYTVTPTLVGCIGTPQTVTVTVNPSPVVTSANTATICSGQAVNIPLTSNPAGATFTWIATDNTNVTGESLTNQTTSTLNNTLTNTSTSVQNVTYTVTPTLAGCVGTPQTVTVTVNPLPIVTSANTATICSGQAVNIPLTSNPAGATFTWIATDNTNVTGESLTNQTTSTLNNTLTNTSTSVQNVTYTVTPTLAGCIGTPQTVTVTVNPLPIVTSANTATICSGQAVNIPLTSNPAGATFTWIATDNTNVTGESLTNQTTSTLNNTLTNTTATAQNVTYTVTPTLAGCIGTPQTVTVTLNPSPVVTSANTATICSGQAVNIPLTSNPAGATFTWIATDNTNVTGESLTNQTTSTLNNTLTNTSTSVQNVTYTVTPTLAGCIGTPQTVTVTVNPLPVVTSANTATICSGQAVNIPLTSNPAGATFTWIATDNTNVTGESLTNQATSTLNNTLTSTSLVPETVTYTVTPTLGTCVGTPQTVTVTVNPIPVAGITNNSGTTVITCAQPTISVTGTGGGAYSWSGGLGTNANATISAPGTYTLTVTGVGGCTDTETITITQDVTPPVAAITNNTGTNVLTCTTTSINVTATGGVSYSWSGGLGTSAGATISAPGTYTVTVTGANGCTDTESITITQNIAVPTAGITNNSGTTVLLCTQPSISVTATGGGTYSWDNGLGTNANATITSAGTYTVTVTGANGCTDTESITITADPTVPTAVITNNTGTTVLTCTTTSISLTASGGATYSWDNGLGTNPTVTITAPGTYIVTAIASNGCTDTEVITITQDIAVPTAGITNNTGTTLLTCTTTAISLTGTGGGTYSWSGGLGSSSAASATAPGTYTLTVTGANGCTDTEVITITQDIAAPTAGITNNSGTSVLTCTTTSISVTATGGGTYSWDNGLGSAANANITAPGAYTVTVNSPNGCTDTEVITITQDVTPPTAGITNNTGTTVLTCTTTSISVTATGGVSYSWDNGLGSAAGATITAPGTYTVTATAANGCTDTEVITITQDVTPPTAGITNNTGTTVLTCTTTSISVTATGGVSYSWDNGLGSAAGATITAPGTYTVTATAANGCTDTEVITITQDVTPPTAGITNNTGTTILTCTTTSISVTATGGGTYSWDNGLGNTANATITAPGTYTVTVTSANGCFDTESITITDNIVLPTAGITNNTGTTVLTCTTTSISVTATGGVSYSWDNGLGSAAGATITAPGTYTVTATAANGCTDTEVITITQDVTPPTAGITNNTGATELTCILTSISVTATGGVSYSWDNGLGTNANATITSAGTYTVTVTGANGCTDTEVITITSDPAIPTAGITNNTGTTVLTCTTTSISVTGTGGVSYSWDNGLGSAAGATITAPGTYTVTATAANGCTDTEVITITQDITAPTAGITNNTGTTVLTCTTTSISVTATGGVSYSWE
jgi:hypothetical protein